MSQELEFIVYEASREAFRVPWRGRRLIIGRHPDADIRVQEPTMSARHAELTPVGSRVSIRDLNSLNGSLLNGVRVVESMLRPGDQIEIGLVRIEVSVTRPSSPHVLAGSSEGDGFFSGQTVKVRLDQLRRDREDLDEDERILHLRDLMEALKEAREPDTLLSKVRSVLEAAYPKARVFILRPRGEDGWHDVEMDPREDRLPSVTFTAEAVRTASAILSTSLPEDQRFSAATSVRLSGIETAIAAPTSCDGNAVAVLYVDRLGLPPFDRRDLNLLGIAANHVSAVLESVSRFNELQGKHDELRQARERLAQLNRDLELRVQERTAELEERNQQLESQREEIIRLAEDKDELLGIAAHDIRGPLTVIQGTIELLQMRAGLDEAMLGRSLHLMHDSARGLSQLLSELLDAKAIEAGTVKLRLDLMNLEEIVEAALPVARLAAEDKRIVLEMAIQPGLRLEADPQRLGQAITNLLLNAVKFSKPGSRIHLAGNREDGDRIEVVVQDFGIGIPKAEIDRIFGRFEQGKAGKQLGGSGLGLMIAKRIVELHDGRLSVNSEVGVGSRFVLSLPAAGGEAAGGEAAGGEATGDPAADGDAAEGEATQATQGETAEGGSADGDLAAPASTAAALEPVTTRPEHEDESSQPIGF